MNLWKNVYFRLGLISALATIALLIVLPRTPIQFNKWGFELNSYIGGYFIQLPGGRVLDLQELKRGLDLEGGVRIVLNADTSNIDESERANALESAREVISRRVNLLGVTEPNIQTVNVGDESRLIVEIPGVANVNQAIELIGQTAQLNFKVLKEDVEWDEARFFEYITDPTVWEDAGLTGADLRGADVVFQQGVSQTGGVATQGAPSIQLRFSNEGREKFGEIASANVNKPVALLLDDQFPPLSAPLINPDLADGIIQDPIITGNFDIETANNLSVQLRAGALPVPVEVLEHKTISATLGQDSVQKSFFAGVVGLLLVMLFMVVMYGKLGLLADISLIIYTLFVLAIFKLIPVTLTLPGIAGFILSIGVAADANILIFERIKEERRWGAPTSLSIKLGFDRAWNSIRDSNVASLITATILFYFGTGAIRGFALTLAIGVLVSLFCALVVVRTLVEVFGGGSKVGMEAKK